MIAAARFALAAAVVLALPQGRAAVVVDSVDFEGPYEEKSGATGAEKAPAALGADQGRQAASAPDIEEDIFGLQDRLTPPPPLPPPSVMHLSHFTFRSRLAEACNPNVTLVAYSQQERLRFYLGWTSHKTQPEIRMEQYGRHTTVEWLDYESERRMLHVASEGRELTLAFKDFTRDVERIVERLSCFAVAAGVRHSLPPPPLYDRELLLNAMASIISKDADGYTSDPAVATPCVPGANVRVTDVKWDLDERPGEKAWMHQRIDADITMTFLHHNATMFRQWQRALLQKQMLLVAHPSVKMIMGTLQFLDGNGEWDDRPVGAPALPPSNEGASLGMTTAQLSRRDDPHWSVYLIAGLVVVAVSACLGTFAFCIYRQKVKRMREEMEREYGNRFDETHEHRRDTCAVDVSQHSVAGRSDTVSTNPALYPNAAYSGRGRALLPASEPDQLPPPTLGPRGRVRRSSDRADAPPTHPGERVRLSASGEGAQACVPVPHPLSLSSAGHRATGATEFSDDRSLDRYESEAMDPKAASLSRYGRPHGVIPRVGGARRSSSFPDLPRGEADIDFVPGPGWESTMDGTDLSMVSDMWVSHAQSSMGAREAYPSPTAHDSRQPRAVPTKLPPSASIPVRRDSSRSGLPAPPSPSRSGHVANFDSGSIEPPTETEYSQ
eukprot:TRINITY_DN8610_c0_g1_i1.p1 TRINITY_DN8610_c0_g1~~TRINITY_DN8610_c0_g1_i1.p1  ORF type:complete len:666 (+),score=167.82 TRINITY_DN8610_c0_g1_i1:104-2101(+)